VLKGFRDFLLRGNVVDLAVAVVIGAAFGAVVTAFVGAFLTPVIGLIGVKGAFKDARFTVNGSDFAYGAFVEALITFVLVAAAIYFLVIVPMTRIMERRARPATDVSTRDCPECLSTIPRAASRCSFCTAVVGASS